MGDMGDMGGMGISTINYQLPTTNYQLPTTTHCTQSAFWVFMDQWKFMGGYLSL